jgi:hypothetical protein
LFTVELIQLKKERKKNCQITTFPQFVVKINVFAKQFHRLFLKMKYGTRGNV